MIHIILIHEVKRISFPHPVKKQNPAGKALFPLDNNTLFLLGGYACMEND